MLVRAVDKDSKGAVTYEEFADLIYGERVNIGGPAHETQERHVRHVTKNLVDSLVSKSEHLGKAFCEIDPERRYMINKAQFANALGTASHHISNQAIEFLWAAQFPGASATDTGSQCVDWRAFMSDLANFSSSNRAPTPCCIQGRKRQYDLLQRTAALTGGQILDLDLNRPDQNASDEMRIVADKLVGRAANLPHKARAASILTPSFVEELRVKGQRVENSLPRQLPKKRLKALLASRDVIHEDELTDLIYNELQMPYAQQPVEPLEPLYGSTYSGSGLESRTLKPKSAASAAANPSPGREVERTEHSGLKLVKADIEAFVATRHHNRDHEVDVAKMIESLYKPEHERTTMETVDDGLNRQKRMTRPRRERPPHAENPRYENYWQARYVMEQLNDAIMQVETSNGGKVKSSRMFKLLDMDGDCYVTLSDMKRAFDKYKVLHSDADLHACFSELDRYDKGSIDIGEFTRHFSVHQGNLLDNMEKPIKAVFHEGGVRYGGPLQDELDARDRNIAEGKMLGNMSGPEKSPRTQSEPPHSRHGGSDRSSVRSTSTIGRLGATLAGGAPMIYAPQVAQLTGDARISDVIRARFSQWKPSKAELYTSSSRSRFGMTCYPDTRHVTEASMPLSGSHLPEYDRFKTTNNAKSIFAVPDYRDPQAEDAMRNHARNEFRVERIRHRQRDFTERCSAAHEASREFDTLKVARKALNQLNYERRCQMSCA